MSFSVDNGERLGFVCRSLARRNRWHKETRLKEEALDMLLNQAREIVRLEQERDNLLGVVSMPNWVEPVDVVTDDEAVAFITEVSNRWEESGREV